MLKVDAILHMDVQTASLTILFQSHFPNCPEKAFNLDTVTQACKPSTS